ncbi:vacuolar protein sorting-associated protein 32 homolog 2-like [Tasmannia lanceolata]|uniref:vacuolar protein sorting-associated protein 32 homolog 2-like n=1 Tax=Tasmannia lanceolata TaxID=3420 RepID=UPI0040631BC9
MFTGLFRKCKEADPLPSTVKQSLEMLEERKNVLQKKISVEVERAKQYIKTKNKQAALQCLKRKKLYEVQMEHLKSYQLRIHVQILDGRNNYNRSCQCNVDRCNRLAAM